MRPILRMVAGALLLDCDDAELCVANAPSLRRIRAMERSTLEPA